MRYINSEEHDLLHNHSVRVFADWYPAVSAAHWHTFGELLYFPSGGGRYLIKGREYRPEAGDLLFIWPCEMHATVQPPASPALLIQFSWNAFATSPEMNLLLNYLRKLQHLPCREYGALTEKLMKLFEELQEVYRGSASFTDTRLRLVLIRVFLSVYDSLTEAARDDQSGARFRNPEILQRLIRTCEYISENCEKPISLESAAEYTGVSKYHFSRIFREYTDTTFSEYLTSQRVARATALLENPELSISAVASLAGFGSLASFNRAFRRVQDCTPTEYRNIQLREIFSSSDGFQLPFQEP